MEICSVTEQTKNMLMERRSVTEQTTVFLNEDTEEFSVAAAVTIVPAAIQAIYIIVLGLICYHFYTGCPKIQESMRICQAICS